MAGELCWRAGMMWRTWLCGLLCAMLVTEGCGKSRSVPTLDKIEPRDQGQELPTVIVDVKESTEVTLPNTKIYECEYHARGKAARFRIRIRQNRPISQDFPMV